MKGDPNCAECWGTGHVRGWGATCSRTVGVDRATSESDRSCVAPCAGQFNNQGPNYGGYGYVPIPKQPEVGSTWRSRAIQAKPIYLRVESLGPADTMMALVDGAVMNMMVSDLKHWDLIADPILPRDIRNLPGREVFEFQNKVRGKVTRVYGLPLPIRTEISIVYETGSAVTYSGLRAVLQLHYFIT